MITIGLTTFSEHPSLIDGAKRKVRLTEYSGHFPVVELDTPFYAIPKVEVVTNWQKQVPKNFQFILKANRSERQFFLRYQTQFAILNQSSYSSFKSSLFANDIRHFKIIKQLLDTFIINRFEKGWIILVAFGIGQNERILIIHSIETNVTLGVAVNLN